ncbi:polysaccharide pyruvyl transferase family protein [Marinobacter sp. BGYM27]|uniref:polysaccharide pyruvyl transferase family protein n=1 Tax=unclassified Marinobacter TaxID=83889 RepID=UPI0021A8CE82|nr:polysaccharide pyruvyl transferase family protein [Marinobacter sp. BGYM27]MDG5501330.1 polysaccharide pyruvyl transferase family protein [Marinobacter sp. BGYM27]
MAKFFYFFDDFINLNLRNRAPVYYFSAEQNVGDLLTPYLIEKLTGRTAHNVKSRYFRHMLAVGSMMHRAKSNSDIWGTGTLGPEIASKISVSDLKVHALRGHLSKALLYGDDGNGADIPLGDPAVLMKGYFDPQVEKKYRIGIVPHYVDEDLSMLHALSREDTRVINVRNSPEAFILELLECEFILSSSLHGLILADTYGVPNKWASFSDGLAGGRFKFADYYSTTCQPDEDVVRITDEKELRVCLESIGALASVKQFNENKERLEASFPKEVYR